MDNLNVDKSGLRKKMLGQRLALSQSDVRERSAKVAGSLRRLEPVIKARVIMAYATIKNEVDLQLCLEGFVREGKTVLLPRVEGNELQAVEWRGWENCRSGSFSIKEPQGRPYEPGKIDAVLVPGLAFDARGYRLGYGKGYYDRFLALLSPDAFFCGIAYQFQLVDTIYPDENDIPLHWIVTEQSSTAVEK